MSSRVSTTWSRFSDSSRASDRAPWQTLGSDACVSACSAPARRRVKGVRSSCATLSRDSRIRRIIPSPIGIALKRSAPGRGLDRDLDAPVEVPGLRHVLDRADHGPETRHPLVRDEEGHPRTEEKDDAQDGRDVRPERMARDAAHLRQGQGGAVLTHPPAPAEEHVPEEEPVGDHDHHPGHGQHEHVAVRQAQRAPKGDALVNLRGHTRPPAPSGRASVRSSCPPSFGGGTRTSTTFVCGSKR